MKRILCLFAVVLLVACMTVPAFGAEIPDGWTPFACEFFVDELLFQSYYDTNLNSVEAFLDFGLGLYVVATPNVGLPFMALPSGEYIIMGNVSFIPDISGGQPYEVAVHDPVLETVTLYNFGDVITVPEGAFYVIMVQSFITPVVYSLNENETGGAPSYDFNLVDNFRALITDVLYGNDEVSVIGQQYINVIAWGAVLILLLLPFLLVLLLIKFVGRWR